MLFTDYKAVSSTYKMIYSSIGSVLAHTEFCNVYMLFTASFMSVCSTYRVILYYYVYFLQPLLGLPLSTHRVNFTHLWVHALYRLEICLLHILCRLLWYASLEVSRAY